LYGIPFNLTDRYPLNTSQPVIAVINFLEILENDFYYKNIFRALTGGFIKLESIDLSNLLRASVNLKIISGFNNWKMQLKDALLKKDDDDEDSLQRFEKRVYEKALTDIDNISKILKPFGKKLTIKEFQQNLKGLIHSLDIPLNILKNGGSAIEKNTKAISAFLETVDEMLELFIIEHGNEKQFPLSFYLDNLRTAVTATRYNIKEKPGYGVQVTTLNEIRGLQFDYLFISGLCDGDLPTRYQPEIFFSGSYARKESRHQTEERYHFYQALCSWNNKLYFTYPQQEVKKELARSNYLTEFLSLFKTGEKTKVLFEDCVYSIDELLNIFGQKQTDEIEEKLVENNIDTELIIGSIKINEERSSNSGSESPFEGYIGSGLSNEEKLHLEEFKDREFSISQLETYAKCPFKYFAERILKLEPPEEPAEEIESLELGSLLHNILFKFYAAIKEKGIILDGASGSDLQIAEDILFAEALRQITDANLSSPINFFEKEKILGIKGDRKKSLLYLFLMEEQKSGAGFIPWFFEISFGGMKKDASSTNSLLTEFTAGNTRVRGKIDRIDLRDEDKKFKVIDYKLSGKKPSFDDMNRGISLQLPLYMSAASALIKAQLNFDTAAFGAEIYSLKFNEKLFGKFPVRLTEKSGELSETEIENSNNKIIKICVDAINLYVKLISEGKFNLSTLHDREKQVCSYCNFRSVCRIQDIN
ncbi:MAG: exodeoxyribonuclease V subunit gamma, partial [Ignavibacteriaceae bacterium]|nr:exodeoxyribonuclease V subunit gamma [Ignavibacteriaceae bacterium]